MTHDPMCPTQTMCKCKDQECWDCREVVLCQCDLVAKVRADEQAKYVLPDLPRGGDHVDWCRDLACYGCEEITDGVIAQSL